MSIRDMTKDEVLDLNPTVVIDTVRNAGIDSMVVEARTELLAPNGALCHISVVSIGYGDKGTRSACTSLEQVVKSMGLAEDGRNEFVWAL